MPTPAANNIQIQDRKLNSGEESLPPSLIFPKGEIIRRKMITVIVDIEIVNKVSKRETTKFLQLERKSPDDSGKIKIKEEKMIAKPELTMKTG
tara:strand:+ start:520 stop:798 length:279 start_codon:yes stop_codon:yes gene_type:complete